MNLIPPDRPYQPDEGEKAEYGRIPIAATKRSSALAAFALLQKPSQESRTVATADGDVERRETVRSQKEYLTR